MIDSVTGLSYIECSKFHSWKCCFFLLANFKENAVGSCERNICECDKAFANKLPNAAADPEDGWSEAHHAHYGGFDSRNQCMRKLTPGGNDKELVCCGEYPDR